MELTLEQWEEKKKQLSDEIKNKISDKIFKCLKFTKEEWEIKKIELHDNVVYKEHYFYESVLIEKVMQQYDIKFDGQLLEDFQFAMSWDEESAKEVFLTPNYELSKLVYFLRQSLYNDSNLTITSTIKGVKNKIEINHENNINNLYFLCDSLLYSRSGKEYEHEFDWKEKESYYSKHKEDVLYRTLHLDGTETIKYDNEINVFAGIVDAYSEIELKKIIEYENEEVKDSTNYYKEFRKTKIKDMVLELRVKGIFDKSFKTISTKEACFIFDVLVALETIPHDTTLNNQEKYQYIKRILLS